MSCSDNEKYNIVLDCLKLIVMFDDGSDYSIVRAFNAIRNKYKINKDFLELQEEIYGKLKTD